MLSQRKERLFPSNDMAQEGSQAKERREKRGQHH